MMSPTVTAKVLGIVLGTLPLILFVPPVSGQSAHQEKIGPETVGRLDRERRLAFHTRLLREAVRSSPLVEVVRDIEDVRQSLRFIAEHGAGAGGRTARTVAQVFTRTEDAEAKRLCLLGLKMIGSKTARTEMLRIYHDEGMDDHWRVLIAEYLKLPGHAGM